MDIYIYIYISCQTHQKKQNNPNDYPHLFQTNKYPKDPNIIWLPKHYPQDSPQLPTNLAPKDGSRSRTCKTRWSHRRKMCLGVISIVEQTLVVNCKPKTSPLSGNIFLGWVYLITQSMQWIQDSLYLKNSVSSVELGNAPELCYLKFDTIIIGLDKNWISLDKNVDSW